MPQLRPSVDHLNAGLCDGHQQDTVFHISIYTWELMTREAFYVICNQIQIRNRYLTDFMIMT